MNIRYMFITISILLIIQCGCIGPTTHGAYYLVNVSMSGEDFQYTLLLPYPQGESDFSRYSVIKGNCIQDFAKTENGHMMSINASVNITIEYQYEYKTYGEIDELTTNWIYFDDNATGRSIHIVIEYDSPGAVEYAGYPEVGWNEIL